MSELDLKKIISNEYLIDVINIEKNNESTIGNVYIVYTNNKNYVLKIYEDINHTNSMTSLHSNLSNNFNVPSIIKNRNNNLYVTYDSKYLVLYSFLEGIQVGKLDNFNEELIKKIAIEVRKLHDLTPNNKYNLKEVLFCKNYRIKRISLLHFDLTKSNIFYSNKKIGFIDFDDAKYGPSVCDVAILILLFFFSKKRGVDLNKMNIFIETYYGNDIELKLNETRYIKEIAINWINYVLDGNDFDTSLKESFEIKKKLIQENM